MEKEILTITTDQKNIDKVVKTIFEYIKNGQRIFLFKGDLGAGKTTLIRKIIQKKLPEIKVPSPTFTIERIYSLKDFDQDIEEIHHLDLYRLQNFTQMNELGLINLLGDPKYLFFIEWPELIIDKLKHYVLVNISLEKNNRRTYEFKKI